MSLFTRSESKPMPASVAAPSFNATRPRRLTGSLVDLPAYEQAAIIAMAEAYHIPPEALGALRVTVNGRGGGPTQTSVAFGIQSQAADEQDEYGEQLRSAAEALATAIVRFQAATGQAAWTGSRLRDGFFSFFASRFCPAGQATEMWVKMLTESYRGGGCEWA